VGIACGALLLAASLGASPTAGAQAIRLHPLPIFKADGELVLMPKAMVMSMLREALPKAEWYKLEDERYFFVTRAWIEQMQRWHTDYVIRQLGPERGKEYLFSRARLVAPLFSSVVGLSIGQDRNARGQPLVGVLSVECNGIVSQEPVDGHLCYFVIFGTAEGFQLLDPSTGRIEFLKDSALRAHARVVLF
jgi:hypothetical protein